MNFLKNYFCQRTEIHEVYLSQLEFCFSFSPVSKRFHYCSSTNSWKHGGLYFSPVQFRDLLCALRYTGLNEKHQKVSFMVHLGSLCHEKIVFNTYGMKTALNDLETESKSIQKENSIRLFSSCTIQSLIFCTMLSLTQPENYMDTLVVLKRVLPCFSSLLTNDVKEYFKSNYSIIVDSIKMANERTKEMFKAVSEIIKLFKGNQSLLLNACNNAQKYYALDPTLAKKLLIECIDKPKLTTKLLRSLFMGFIIQGIVKSLRFEKEIFNIHQVLKEAGYSHVSTLNSMDLIQNNCKIHLIKSNTTETEYFAHVYSYSDSILTWCSLRNSAESSLKTIDIIISNSYIIQVTFPYIGNINVFKSLFDPLTKLGKIVCEVRLWLMIQKSCLVIKQLLQKDIKTGDLEPIQFFKSDYGHGFRIRMCWAGKTLLITSLAKMIHEIIPNFEEIGLSKTIMKVILEMSTQNDQQKIVDNAYNLSMLALESWALKENKSESTQLTFCMD